MRQRGSGVVTDSNYRRRSTGTVSSATRRIDFDNPSTVSRYSGNPGSSERYMYVYIMCNVDGACGVVN